VYLQHLSSLQFLSYAAFFAVVMALFTLICAMASANSWSAYDRSVLLLRAREALAATDPLTGCPNRREFLERLGRAIESVMGMRPPGPPPGAGYELHKVIRP